jgi:CDGSH-type Zn-finger protein
MTDQPENEKPLRKIVIMKNGSYHVTGEPPVPLVHKKQVVSEHGEPLTWEKTKDYHAQNKAGNDFYSLCRCGHSKFKPYCDGSHHQIAFDGTETADTNTFDARAYKLPYGERIIVRKDPSLCMNSGYCGFSDASLAQLLAKTADTKIRALVMAMVERCPAGALTYRIEPDGPDIEPDLPEQVAWTTEITSDGEIPGPLWVTGNIPVVRSDGKPFETRNRVTLCCCGDSDSKPLCDGTHRYCEQKALREKKAREK